MHCKSYIYILTLVLIFLMGSPLFAFAQEASEEEHDHDHPKIDSAMAISPQYMPVYWATAPTAFFNPLEYRELDLSSFHVSDYAPFLSAENLYQTLGINGQAHQSMVFDYERTIDFSMMEFPYPLYFKKQKDLRYYDVETSFTNIAYTFGFLSEHNFHATHTQRIKDFSYAVNLDAIGNPGYFIHQNVNFLSLDALCHYQTKNDIYGFNLSYILNHAKFSENGGLSDYHSFADRIARDTNITNNLSSFNVMFSNASSLINTHDLQFLQYVNIKDKKGHYFGTVSHTFQFKMANSSFLDYDLNNDFYQDRYYLSTDSTKDTLTYYNIINTVQWSNYSPVDRQSESNYSFRIAGGFRHEFTNIHIPHYIANNISLFARTSIRLFKVWDIYGNFAYSFLKYNKDDAIANVAATFAINRAKRHFIGLGADFYRVSPDFFYTAYVGNNNLWEKSWPKQNNLKLSAYYTIFNYKVSFNYFMMNHYVYLDNDFQPKSYEKSINVVQLNLFAPLRIKNFFLDANLSLQHSTKSYISVPLFAGKLFAAYKFKVFKNRLDFQIGGDLMYNTLYYADAYNPLVHQFYHQERTKVGNYLYFDINITMQVERIAFFFRAGNLLAGAFSYKYFTTPYYPMQGQNFEIGLTWRFYD